MSLRTMPAVRGFVAALLLASTVALPATSVAAPASVGRVASPATPTADSAPTSAAARRAEKLRKLDAAADKTRPPRITAGKPGAEPPSAEQLKPARELTRPLASASQDVLPTLPEVMSAKQAAAGTQTGAARVSSSADAATPDKGLLVADWEAPAATDELIVTYLSAASGPAVQASARAFGAQAVRTGRDGKSMLIRVPRGLSRENAARSLAANSAVRSVQPNYKYVADWIPNDPQYSSQWGLPKIGAPAAWDVTKSNSTVVVAVVDTGVDLSHADLVARCDTANDYDAVNGDYTAQDDEGHGTHVAGTIAATTNNGVNVAGVAPEAKILPIKVLDWRGSGYTYDIADGVSWATDHGADIVNMSLGGGSYDAYFESVLNEAQSSNVLVVAAVGNDGSSGGASYPARYAGVLGVAATDSGDAHAYFSNYGTGVDIAAPGVDILSTSLGGGTEQMSGTSMATPHVAGVAALVRAAQPSLTQAQVASRLTSTAKDLGTAGWDNYFGYGRVQASAAVGATDPSNPDDDIPGIALPASPASGSVSSSSDRYDVYKVYLTAGQQFGVSMTGPGGTDFDIALYGPSATSVGGSTPIAESSGVTYPEQVTYTATSTGYHYLAVFAYAGSGTYSLTWSTSTTGSADDNIPGVAMPASPVNGSLNGSTDRADVYKVYLSAGEQLNVSLSGAGGTDFDLFVFGPSATNIYNDGPVASSAGVSYPEQTAYPVTASGYYYVTAYSYSGTGSYTLTWSKGTAGTADDNIPGVPLPSSPAAGYVSNSTDYVDVYKVWVDAGKRISLSLSAPSGDLDLYLFDPSATDAYIDGAVAWATDTTYPESVVYSPAPTSGYYYVAVSAFDGAANYTLTWSVTAPYDSDGNIPGWSIGDSPVAGTLSNPDDLDDVHKVYMTAGQQLTLSLTGSSGTDFDLYLFEPTDTDVTSDAPAAESNGLSYPETITYRAATTGYHYVDVFAYSGTGSYTLTWSLSSGGGDGGADDDIPGVAIPASPVSGSVSYSTDQHDVYKVYMTSGQTIDVSLTGAGGTDIDVALFDPTATSIHTYEPIAGSYGTEYPEAFSYRATSTGYHYLDVMAYDGAGSYTMTWSLRASASDDDIPGVALPASPVAGALTDPTDAHDVYKVYVPAGQMLNVSVTAAEYADVDVSLYAPSATSIDLDDPVAGSYDTEYPEQFGYVAAASGYHYIDVFTCDGSSSYSLSWSIGAKPTPTAERFAGANRYETARMMSQEFASGSCDAIIIATGTNYPDALSAAGLAGAVRSPILLVGSTFDAATKSELRRLVTGQSSYTVYIVGGTAAVSSSIETAIKSQLTGETVVRLGGSDRYATSNLIAQRIRSVVGGDLGGAFVVTGTNYPDALLVSPLAYQMQWPIIVTSNASGVNTAMANTMVASGVTDAYVVGSTSAVTEATRTYFDGRLEGGAVRIAGSADRYVQGVNVANWASENLDSSFNGVAIATGENYPDALVAGPLQGESGSLLLFTHGTYLDTVVRDCLVAHTSEIYDVRFCGGTSAVSNSVQSAVLGALD